MRFEIKKACEQERWRLKMCYADGSGGEVQLGLLWSEDLPGLEALRKAPNASAVHHSSPATGR